MTLKEACRLSKIKWKKAYETGHDSLSLFLWCSQIDELKNLNSNCGFCHRHMEVCEYCELSFLWGWSCGSESSLFLKWRYEQNIDMRKVYAKQIYNDICTIERGIKK